MQAQPRRPGPWPRFIVVLAALVALGGCATVHVATSPADKAILLKRGDVLTRGSLSDAALATLRSAAIEPADCQRYVADCLARLRRTEPLGDEARLATLAEVASVGALRAGGGDESGYSDAAIAAWLDVARYAYGYLFLTARAPHARVFEARQNQVRDYYNVAVQHVALGVAERDLDRLAQARDGVVQLRAGGWSLAFDLTHFPSENAAAVPVRLIPTDGLRFRGLYTTFRRDGFGSEIAVELAADSIGDPAAAKPPGSPHRVSRVRFVPLTVVIDFPGRDLAEVLATDRATVYAFDPYEQRDIDLHGSRLPLAANFSAGYGVWLAESPFARQATLSLLGRPGGLREPHVYRMQRFDPDRRILLMIHGLASSPEAWVNLANEVMGDEALRDGYQIWQVYYPTGLPLAWNHHELREVLAEALDEVDPAGTSRARHDIVVVGHSMGGVLARLLVSNPGDELSQWLDARLAARGGDAALAQRLRPFVDFAPMPGIRRAVFMAAPHRGTPAAERGIGWLFTRLIRTPLELREHLQSRLGDEEGIAALGGERARPTSIDSLRDTDPFMRAAASVPIAAGLPYHSIIGVEDAAAPLQVATDGLVPYASAHLDGAVSELVIAGDHHVQERLESMLELRRIQRLHMQAE